jgi:hypothetical protein
VARLDPPPQQLPSRPTDVAAQSRQGMWRDSVRSRATRPGTTKRATFYKFSLWRIIFNKLDLKVLKIKQIPSPWCYYSFSPFLIDSLSPAASLLISQSPSQSPQSSLMVQKICEVVYAMVLDLFGGIQT